MKPIDMNACKFVSVENNTLTQNNDGGVFICRNIRDLRLKNNILCRSKGTRFNKKKFFLF